MAGCSVIYFLMYSLITLVHSFLVTAQCSARHGIIPGSGIEINSLPVMMRIIYEYDLCLNKCQFRLLGSFK